MASDATLDGEAGPHSRLGADSASPLNLLKRFGVSASGGKACFFHVGRLFYYARQAIVFAKETAFL